MTSGLAPRPGFLFLAICTERWVRGKPSHYECRLRFAQIGPVELELIEPIKGECLQKEFLDSKGEGIHHLGFFVDDLDTEVSNLVRHGIEVIQSGKRLTGGGFAYLNTNAIGGIVLELIQR